jgi:ribonuclease HI
MTENPHGPAGHDFELYTDGSGWNDNQFGGHAFLIISTRHNLYEQRVVGWHGISVDRAEFMALLHGLRTIQEVMGWTSPDQVGKLSIIKPTVKWYCDRKSLVGSVNNPEQRHAQGDLWAQYAWYEKIFKVDGTLIPRDTNDNHNVADALASEIRMVMKAYLTDAGLLTNDKDSTHS